MPWEVSRRRHLRAHPSWGSQSGFSLFSEEEEEERGRERERGQRGAKAWEKVQSLSAEEAVENA